MTTFIPKQNPDGLFPLAALITSCCLSMGVQADDISDSIENALKFGQQDAKYGQIKFDLNYRYEFADTENTPQKPANGNTFRLRLGYLTPEFYGIQGFAEYENLYAAQNDYNSPTYGYSDYHVIADPADRHELNRLWLRYIGLPDTEIKGGRQRIKLDDDRFIGNVGWRQMEQTYDSVMVTNKSIKDVTVKAGYIGRVRNIFSLTDEVDAPFVNLNYNMGSYGNAIAYGYWLDYQHDRANYGKSSATYGIRFTGSPQISDDLKFNYNAEYSYQEDFGTQPVSYHADRYNLMAGFTLYGITANGAMEELGGDGTRAFTTPLGTNHAFQGWADRFLVTPADGLRDINFTLASMVAGAKVMFVYHHFEDDSGSINFADEYDFLIVKKFGKHYSLLAKYAFYDGDDDAPGAFKNDTQKFWLQANVSF